MLLVHSFYRNEIALILKFGLFQDREFLQEELKYLESLKRKHSK